MSHLSDSQLGHSLRMSTGELSSVDNHPADVGTETFERSRDLAINATLSEEYSEIEAALKRIEDGTYGVCLISHENIPFAGAGEGRQEHSGRFDDAGAWETVEDYGSSNTPAMSSKRDVTNYADVYYP